ncbi:MAG: hypothetical protein K5787_08600 [Lentisphaeria bacterium]|nr:hypothetical protein [Lentisphaeria bacterium]
MKQFEVTIRTAKGDLKTVISAEKQRDAEKLAEAQFPGCVVRHVKEIR